MKVQALVGMLILESGSCAFAADEFHVVFDVYYKDHQGEVIEHAVSRLPIGAASKIVLRSGLDVDLGTAEPQSEKGARLLVQVDGVRIRQPIIYWAPSKDQSSFNFHLPEKRQLTVFVRTAEYWPSGS